MFRFWSESSDNVQILERVFRRTKTANETASPDTRLSSVRRIEPDTRIWYTIGSDQTIGPARSPVHSPVPAIGHCPLLGLDYNSSVIILSSQLLAGKTGILRLMSCAQDPMQRGQWSIACTLENEPERKSIESGPVTSDGIYICYSETPIHIREHQAKVFDLPQFVCKERAIITAGRTFTWGGRMKHQLPGYDPLRARNLTDSKY
eukprot:1181412-Prorocentrum_minimum.AAC.1